MMKAISKDTSTNLIPGISVIYHHFAGSLEVFTGTIVAVKETRKSRMLLITPDKREDMSLQSKWVSWIDIVSYDWSTLDSAEGSDKQQFEIGGSVRIKQHVNKDLNYFLRKARDTRATLKIVALNPDPGEYQVKVEYDLDGDYTRTALFRLTELEGAK